MNMIIATTKNGIIGIDNKIPWYIKADLQRFRALTNNHIVIMGRKTFESLPNGPLKNRINIVITKDPTKIPQYENVYCTTINKTDELIEKIQEQQESVSKKQLFIIGGAQVYNYFTNKIQKIYLTMIDKDLDGDTFFNTDFLRNIDSEFSIKNISEQQICPYSNLPYTFIDFERKN